MLLSIAVTFNHDLRPSDEHGNVTDVAEIEETISGSNVQEESYKISYHGDGRNFSGTVQTSEQDLGGEG